MSLFNFEANEALFETAKFPEKPLVLGESVFNQFIKPEEAPLHDGVSDNNLEFIESPISTTISPIELHSSIIESVFSTPEIESPLFEMNEVDSENWESLFDSEEMKQLNEAPAAAPAPVAAPPAVEVELVEPASAPAPAAKPEIRRKRSVEAVAEIDISSISDPVAQKRAKNTEAARRSRARKLEKMNLLEDKVEELTKENSNLKFEIEKLRLLLSQK